MKKSDHVESPDGKQEPGDKLAEIRNSTQRFLDSIPAQIDAIKAKREKSAKELRRFVRQREKDKDNDG